MVIDLAGKNAGKCLVIDCGNNAYVRGHCRKHYRQLLMCGRIAPKRGALIVDGKALSRCERTLRHMAEELEEAKRLYELVVSVEARIRWMKKIRILEEQLEQYKEKEKHNGDD